MFLSINTRVHKSSPSIFILSIQIHSNYFNIKDFFYFFRFFNTYIHIQANRFAGYLSKFSLIWGIKKNFASLKKIYVLERSHATNNQFWTLFLTLWAGVSICYLKTNKKNKSVLTSISTNLNPLFDPGDCRSLCHDKWLVIFFQWRTFSMTNFATTRWRV